MPKGNASKLVTPLYNHWEKLSRTDFTSVMLDFSQYCAKGKMIIDKQGHAVPFVLNEAQREVAGLILPYIFAKVPEPVTLVIHKSRQMGISVLLAALEQYIVSRKQNINITHLFPNDQLANQFFQEKWIPLAEACLMPSAEVLTKRGWVRFDEYEGEDILVGDGARSWFEVPKEKMVYDFDGELISYSTRRYSHISTPQHRMIFKRNGKMAERRAYEGLPVDGSRNRFVTLTELDGEGICIDNDRLKLLVAFSADGHAHRNSKGVASTITFQLARKDKILRLSNLLDRLGVEYTVRPCSGKNFGQVKIRFNAKKAGIIPFKEFPNEWLAKLSLRQRKIILDEMVHWDGHDNRLNKNNPRDSIEYYTTIKYNAEWMATLASTCNISSNISIEHKDNGHSDGYTVRLLFSKGEPDTQSLKIEKVPYSGKVYCVSTSTGMFWTRINGVMSLTGNSHPMVLPDMYATSSPNPYVKVRDFHGVSMGCNVRIGGSESRAGGRSQTNQIVVLDEYAFYQNVSNLERGILATQPKTGLVLTVYVSTSNGANHFYDVVRQAQQPGSRIKHLFLPWHMQKEYEIVPDKHSRFYDLDNYLPTEYDMKLMDIFEDQGYPEKEWVNKLNFYEVTMDKEAKGDQDYMFENYPSEPEESFQATGRPVLPAKVINYWLEHPMKYKYLDQFYDEKKNLVVMGEAAKSSIRQYIPPTPGHRYILSIDPSSGYAADRTAGTVIDMATNEEVCSFVDYIEQTECAELAVNLATYYNKAVILIERNMGETMIEFIKNLHYPRLWLDTKNSTRTLKYGIRTTAPLKNEAIRRLKFLLNQGIYKPHNELFLREAQHFNWTQLPGGGYRAEATGQDDDGNPWHDDCVMSVLCWAASLDMGKFKKYMTKNPMSRSRL